MNSATDQQIETDVTQLIAAYVNSLTFSQDNNGLYNGSPYDQFLNNTITNNGTNGQGTTNGHGRIGFRRRCSFYTVANHSCALRPRSADRGWRATSVHIASGLRAKV